MYMVMSRDQNAGRSYNMKIDNTSYERAEELKYLEINLTYQNSNSGRKCRIFYLPVCYPKI